MGKNIKEAYFKHGSSLALYKNIQEHKDYWENLWQPVLMQNLMSMAKTGQVGEFVPVFSKYLPHTGIILEAGCGTGKYVWALQARGYQIEGVDYAEETIQRIKEVDPELNVRVGDIYAIDRPSNYYSAYISIGVVEHNFDGQMAALYEAYRVLSKGGMALITVPYLNWPRRKLWEKAPEANGIELPSGLRFYQDHLDIEHFSNQITQAGFNVITCYPHGLFGAFIKDWRLGRWLNKKNFFAWRLRRAFGNLCLLAPMGIRMKFSHMMMFVAEKPL
jgi:SAM-dependent methyltransferase